MAKKVFTVLKDGNEVQVETVKAVIELIGKNVTIKQIVAGNVEGVIMEEVQEGSEVSSPNPETQEGSEPSNNPADDSADENGYNDDKEGDSDEAGADDSCEGQGNCASADIEYPEKGHFKEIKDIKKYIKKLADVNLYEWCELEGVTWTANSNPAINRMRAAMAIKAFHFPSTATTGKGKSKSKYADYSYEQLVSMAAEHKIKVKDAKGDQRIARMYVIIALKEAGLLG